MKELEKNDIILKAAIEFGPEYKYDIKQGTLGMTLYVHVKNKKESSPVRKKLPSVYEGLRTIVTYDKHGDGDY